MEGFLVLLLLEFRPSLVVLFKPKLETKTEFLKDLQANTSTREVSHALSNALTRALTIMLHRHSSMVILFLNLFPPYI